MPRSKTYTWDTPPSSTSAPSRLKVATAQIPITGDIDRTWRISKRSSAAAKQGADVVHFPECALSGYGPMDDWPNWQGFDWRKLETCFDALRAAAVESQVGSSAAASTAAKMASFQGTPSSSSTAKGGSPVDTTSGDARGMTCVPFRLATSRSSLTSRARAAASSICLDWSFPELWQELAGKVDLVFHSSVSDNIQRDRIEAHVIQPLLRSYAWLNSYAVSSSNSCRPSQNFSSFWIERSGHMGAQAPKDEIGFAINNLIADEEQDQFFQMVCDFRLSAREHEHA